MITDKLPELMRIQVDAISNIKIDKITVWDSMGGGQNGEGSTTSNWMQSLLKSLPAYDELYNMTGNKLPNLLNVAKDESETSPTPQDTKAVEEVKESSPKKDKKSK